MSVPTREVPAPPRRVTSPALIQIRPVTRRRGASLFLIAALVAQLTTLAVPLAAPTPVVAAGTTPVTVAANSPWVGSGPGSIAVPQAGTGGIAEFTYNLNPAGFSAQTWQFSTTAASTGQMRLNWTYSGFHAYYEVRAKLDAYVKHGTSYTYYGQVDAGPANCCATPSAGFAYNGSAVVPVVAGDEVGFRITGQNYDTNNVLEGTLTVGTEVVSNGSFETPIVSANTFLEYTNGSSAITGWTVGGASVDLIGDGFWNAADGVQSIDLDGSAAGAISQTLSTVQGKQYQLSFQYSANGDAPGTTPSMHVEVNGSQAGASFTHTATARPLTWEAGNLAFTATGPSTVLGFVSDTAGGFGIAIDQVSVFPSLGNAAPDFTIAANPGSKSIAPYASGTVSIDTTMVGAAGSIGLAASISPALQGVTVAVSPTLLNSGSSTPLTITATGDAVPGQYTATVTGTEGTTIRSTHVTVTVLPPTGTPGLLQAIPGVGSTGQFTDTPTSADALFIAGMLNGPAGTYPITLRTADTCPGGVLPTNAGTVAIAPVPAPELPPDVSATIGTGGGTSYFGGPIHIVAGTLHAFVAAQVGSGPIGQCIVASPPNDQWPYAYDISSKTAAGTPTTGYIDTDGRARWYKFNVTPGSSVHLTLSNLPADYDVFLFKDISRAYSDLTGGTPALTKLSAEFASADAANAFSSNAFSSNAFSSNAFSSNAFSSNAFSSNAFSSNAFSSSSTFTPYGVDQNSYSNAQVRSLIGGSASLGTATETVDANVWTNTGSFYIRVNGKGSASSVDQPFTLTVTKSGNVCDGVTTVPTDNFSVADTGRQTLILWDSTKIAGSADDKTTLGSRLATFAARSEIQGTVVDLGDTGFAGYGRIQTLKNQADGNLSCAYAKNLLAGGIKDIVSAYRLANNGLKYVVLVGGDGSIPFFRYPDQNGLAPESDYVPPVDPPTASEASLRSDYVLGQDEYGSKVSLSLGSYQLPIPDLAVGRLVETAAEATGVLNAYLNHTTAGIVAPNDGVGGATNYSSLVTGYDFLADAATTVASDLATGTQATPTTLINQPTDAPASLWTGTQLKTALTTQRNDLVFLAGHFSSSLALAADYTTFIKTSDVTSSSVDMTNSIVFSAGCHSGYNLVDGDQVVGVTNSLDWAQAFAQKGATLIAGTGYQYGDSDFELWSERIYAEFAHQLRVGPGAVAIGNALMRSKQIYLASTPDVLPMDAKALLEATLYGLPMLSVNMPTAGRDTTATGTTSIVGPTTSPGSGPGVALGLKSAGVDINPPTTQITKTLTNVDANGAPTGGSTDVTYVAGEDGVIANPGAPVLPRQEVDVTVSNMVLRGVGFRSGSYTDAVGIIPLTGAPATELSVAHQGFASPVFSPAVPWRVNYFDAFQPGGSTKLILTPAQYKSSGAAGTTTLRTFSSLGLKLFYSTYTGFEAQASAPSIGNVSAVYDGTSMTFQASVTENPAGIQQVWVTYTGTGAGSSDTWQSLDLVQDPAVPGTWRATLPLSPSAAANLRFIVQAANGVGLVGLDSNFGSYYAALNVGVSKPAPSATVVTLDAGNPAIGAFGTSATVGATLMSGGSPVGAKQLTFGIGGAAVVAITDAHGHATASVPLISDPAGYSLNANYLGDDSGLASGAAQAFTIGKLGTSITLTTTPTSVVVGTDSGVVATLLDANGRPIPFRSIYFVVSGPASLTTTATTNGAGKASLGTLPAGNGAFTIVACFNNPAGSAFAGCLTPSKADTTYLASGATRTLDQTGLDQTIAFTAPAGKTFGDADFTIGASTTSGLAVTFTATTSATCSVSGNLVHIIGAGACTIQADQPGDATWNAAPSVTRTFTIAKATPTCTVTAYDLTFDTNAHIATGSCQGVAGDGALTGLDLSGTGHTNADTYTDSWSFAENANYSAAAGTVTDKIAKATPNCASIVGYSGTYDGAPHGATGSCLGHLGANLDGMNLGGSFTTVPGGTATWTFTDGTGNYNDASGSVAIVIGKAPSMTVVSCPVRVTYNGTALVPCTASYSGIGSLTGSLTPGYTNNTAAGTANVSATYGGDANHDGSTGEATFTIDKAPLTITAANQTKILGATLTFAGTEFTTGPLFAGDSVTGVTLTSTGSASSAAVGPYDIIDGSATGVGLDNYQITYVPGTLSVIYRFDGFLQPINDTAYCYGCLASVFQSGSTVPTKFVLKNASGAVVQSSSAPVWLAPLRSGATSGNVLQDTTIYTDPATTGISYPWDGTQYHFNWKTAKNAGGYFWRLGVTLDDGMTYFVYIGLK